jgi:hypothetical protein
MLMVWALRCIGLSAESVLFTKYIPEFITAEGSTKMFLPAFIEFILFSKERKCIVSTKTNASFCPQVNHKSFSPY